MLQARADLTLEGPGVAVRLRGDGPVLVAEVTGEVRAVVRNAAHIVRVARATSRALRRAGLSVHVRVGGRTLVRLG